MIHAAEDGEAKIVETLTCPLAAKTCFTKNSRGWPFFGVTSDVTAAEFHAAKGASLVIADDLRKIAA